MEELRSLFGDKPSCSKVLRESMERFIHHIYVEIDELGPGLEIGPLMSNASRSTSRIVNPLLKLYHNGAYVRREIFEDVPCGIKGPEQFIKLVRCFLENFCLTTRAIHKKKALKLEDFETYINILNIQLESLGKPIICFDVHGPKDVVSKD